MAIVALGSVHVIEAAFPLLLKEGVDRIVANQPNLGLPVSAILAFTVLRYAAMSYGRRRNALISVDLARDLRVAIFSHLQKQGAGFFATYPLGDLMARATNDIEAIRQFFRGAIHQIVSIAAIIVIAPTFMFIQSPFLTSFVAAVLLTIGPISWLLAKSIRDRATNVQAEFAVLTDAAQRNFHGIRTIQSHALENREIERFAATAERYAEANVKLARLRALLDAVMSSSAGVTTLLVVGIGGSEVLRAEMSLGALTAFIFYSSMILGVLRNSSGPAFLFLRASAACSRFFQILDAKPEISDADNAPSGADIVGAIAVDRLTFRYPNGALALSEISLQIEPGEFVAIVGPIGSGKSTFLRLLARQLEPAAGSIYFDGTDIRLLPLTRLRRNSTLVGQDAFLFAASFAENISYDHPERAEALIWGVARAVSLDETIRRSRDGLATSVGERGVALSGGQRQRVNLARGLIRETSILLLDDCFSALDTETESHVLAQVEESRRGLTTILVTHRVSAARYAGKIFVFDLGRIIECGSHEELRQRGGLYADLLQRQERDSVRTWALAQ